MNMFMDLIFCGLMADGMFALPAFILAALTCPFSSPVTHGSAQKHLLLRSVFPGCDWVRCGIEAGRFPLFIPRSPQARQNQTSLTSSNQTQTGRCDFMCDFIAREKVILPPDLICVSKVSRNW